MQSKRLEKQVYETMSNLIYRDMVARFILSVW